MRSPQSDQFQIEKHRRGNKGNFEKQDTKDSLVLGKSGSVCKAEQV